MILTHKNRKSSINFNGKFLLEFCIAELPRSIGEQQASLRYFGTCIGGIPKDDDFLGNLPPSQWISVRRTHMINRQILLSEVESTCQDDVIRYEVNWNDITYLFRVTIYHLHKA